MARIELIKNKNDLDPKWHVHKLLARSDKIIGTHQTEIGELVIASAVSPDGQTALLISGDAMRGKGKHVRKLERLMQTSHWGIGEIQLSQNRWLKIHE